MEILLVKAAVFMLLCLNKLASRDGDVIAVTSLQGVCKLWYNVFTHRRWNQKQLRRSFDGKQTLLLMNYTQICSPLSGSKLNLYK